MILSLGEFIEQFPFLSKRQLSLIANEYGIEFVNVQESSNH